MDQTPLYSNEGTYGCVHNPSLHCIESEKIDYTNKISKILLNNDALKELQEYELMEKVDKYNTFHIEKPKYCKTAKNNINKKAIKKCINLGHKITKNFTNYSLLIMNDGGINLQQYGDEMKRKSKNPININEIENFWFESQRLLLGIKKMIKYKIVHHDLKAQNIVYSKKKNRCNFIDFGLMGSIPELINDCMNNNYKFNINHWSFPFESNLLNKKKFDEIKNMNFIERMKYLTNFTKKSTWFPDHIFNITEKKNKFLEYSDFILYDLDNFKYNIFLIKYFETLDIYGLGLGFHYLLDNTKHLISPNMYIKFKNIFLMMTSSNILNRIEIKELLIKFQEIINPKFISVNIKESMNKISKTIEEPIPIKSHKKTNSLNRKTKKYYTRRYHKKLI